MESPLAKKQRTASSSSEIPEQTQEEQQRPEQQQEIQVTGIEGIDLTCHEGSMFSNNALDLTCHEEAISPNNPLQGIDLTCHEEAISPNNPLEAFEDMDAFLYQQVVNAGYDGVDPFDYTANLHTKQLKPIGDLSVEDETRANLIEMAYASPIANEYPNAIYLAVSVFDQYFGKQPDDALEPELVMHTALGIAVKYEYGLKGLELLEYGIQASVPTETKILGCIRWNLFPKTRKALMEHALKFNQQDILIEASNVFPSLLVGASLFLSAFILHPGDKPHVFTPWDLEISALKSTVRRLQQTFLHRPSFHIRAKFSTMEFGNVATCQCGDIPDLYYGA